MRKNKISTAASTLGKKAGEATFKKYGRTHYKKMAEKR